MEDDLQKMADELTFAFMAHKYGLRFLDCDDITNDDDMNADWEYYNEMIIGSLFFM